jgi:hypothetical protein
MFSLLAEAGGRPLFIGASRTTAAVRRTQGPFRSGTPLNLWINDNNPGAVGGSGFFVCRVRVFRR